LLSLLFPGHNSSSIMVHAQMMMMMNSSYNVNHCYAEPVGLGECSIGKDLDTNGTYFTARFGIPNKIDDDNNNTTTAEDGGQRVIDCRYAWQVIANEVEGEYYFLYTTVTGSALTPSVPNCTENCSAIIPSDMGWIFFKPTTFTIRHRFYILPILEGQNVNMEWDPTSPRPDLDLPPPFSTFQITADGVCTLEEWVPVPTPTLPSTPSVTFGSAMSSLSSSLWPTGLMVTLVFGVAVW
jgi:hypothetical protein